MADLAAPLVVTTSLPASPGTAVRVQARPRMPLPSRVSRSVHPDGLLMVEMLSQREEAAAVA